MAINLTIFLHTYHNRIIIILEYDIVNSALPSLMPCESLPNGKGYPVDGEGAIEGNQPTNILTHLLKPHYY
jgi:hypothetical protein